MENRRALIIAGICFVISIGLIIGYVKVKRSEMTAQFGDEVLVVVANTYIPEYATVYQGMVKTVPVFKRFKQPQTVSDSSVVVGKATYVAIAPGEQIPLTKLIQQDGKPVLGRQVEKSKRAVTVMISAFTGVGRLLRPGNRVDILAAPSFDAKGQVVLEVKTVVQNVLVLATGRRIQNEVPTKVNKKVLDYIQLSFEQRRRQDFYSKRIPPNTTRPADDEYAHITLQLAPEEAEKILFLTSAYGERSLFFTLRNSADDLVVSQKTTLLDDILGPDSDFGRSKIKAPPVKKRPPKFIDNVGGAQVPVN